MGQALAIQFIAASPECICKRVSLPFRKCVCVVQWLATNGFRTNFICFLTLVSDLLLWERTCWEGSSVDFLEDDGSALFSWSSRSTGKDLIVFFIELFQLFDVTSVVPYCLSSNETPRRSWNEGSLGWERRGKDDTKRKVKQNQMSWFFKKLEYEISVMKPLTSWQPELSVKSVWNEIDSYLSLHYRCCRVLAFSFLDSKIS